MTGTYTVIEADYIDREAGLEPGTTVTAEPGDSPAHLLVTHIGDKMLPEPLAVMATQLQAA